MLFVINNNKKSLLPTNNLSLVFFTGTFFLLALLPITIFAAESSLANGQTLFKSCQTCHGKSGEGNALLKSPAIAGQYAWYIKRQLKHFRLGVRGNLEQDTAGRQMAAVSLQLGNDDEVGVLARYIAALPTAAEQKLRDQDEKNSTVLSANNKNGYRYYQGKCGACHGSQGQGNERFNAPRLTGLQAYYLQEQMQHFSAGIRGKSKVDKYGRQMAMMAKTVSVEQLSDIIDYLVAL